MLTSWPLMWQIKQICSYSVEPPERLTTDLCTLFTYLIMEVGHGRGRASHSAQAHRAFLSAPIALNLTSSPRHLASITINQPSSLQTFERTSGIQTRTSNERKQWQNHSQGHLESWCFFMICVPVGLSVMLVKYLMNHLREINEILNLHLQFNI